MQNTLIQIRIILNIEVKDKTEDIAVGIFTVIKKI